MANTGSNPPSDGTVVVSAATVGEISERGIAVPDYDRSALRGRIVHIGVGGFHRAHLAVYTQELAARGGDWAIRGLGVLAGDAAMARALTPQDFLYTLIERGPDEPHAALVGSIIDYQHVSERIDDAVAYLADPVVDVVSLTITEAGYGVDPEPAGEPNGRPPTFGVLARALDVRRRTSRSPVTVLSCDNLPGNGDAARAATLAAAHRLDSALAEWVERYCTFPNSMVDRITPVTADSDRTWLVERHGIVDRWPVVAEPFRQWVVEDHFATERPDWASVGAIFSDDVRAWELYKLRMLNAAHSCMAYLCALAGLRLVDEAMAVPEVPRFLRRLLADEAVPSLTPIDHHPREAYAATLLERFANPGVRDQIARLCIDGSAKFPTFLVPTIEYQLRHAGPIECSALALAGWARYLAVTPVAEQAPDATGDRAREFAVRALDTPERFLDYADVFPASLRDDARFRSAFAVAAARLAALGPVAAMSECDRTESPSTE